MAEYYYLISSLPTLRAEVEPTVKLAAFLEQCAEWLSPTEMKTLHELELVPSDPDRKLHGIAAAWNDWETCLRNAIARHRGASGQDVEAALRPENGYYSEIDAGIQEAWTQTDPLEREKVLFRLRWNFLDDLENGHLFDFPVLCMYKLKLLLLDRRQAFSAAAGRGNFDQTVNGIENRQADAVSH